MPNGNTAGAERQYRAMDGAAPNRDTEGANRRDYSLRPHACVVPRLRGGDFLSVALSVDIRSYGVCPIDTGMRTSASLDAAQKRRAPSPPLRISRTAHHHFVLHATETNSMRDPSAPGKSGQAAERLDDATLMQTYVSKRASRLREAYKRPQRQRLETSHMEALTAERRQRSATQ